MSLAVA